MGKIFNIAGPCNSELFDRLAAGSAEYAQRVADVAKFVVKAGRDADGAFVIDRENVRGGGLGTKWESHATAKVTKRTDGYRIELSVPLASLPGLGGRALVNFGRDRVRKDGTEFILADTPANSYQDVENFATVDFGE